MAARSFAGVAMSGALTGWRVSAGDEFTVFDGNQRKIVSVPIGGISRRTLSEGEATARLIAAAPDLLAALEWIVSSSQAADNDSFGRPQALVLSEAVASATHAIAKAKND